MAETRRERFRHARAAHRLAAWGSAAALLFAAAPVLALSPEDKCEAAKNKEAGKYAFCRQKAEMKAIKKGTAADFTKCDAKLVKKWLKAEAVAAKKGATCVDAISDADIQTFITAHSDAVAAALDGGTLPVCGGGLVPGVDPILGATGQTTPDGPGSDGDVQAGQPLAYTDNGDGTITDHTTGLMWEKKDDAGGIHDKDNAYSWRAVSGMDGTITTGFLDTLNDVSGGGSNCFAGHCDWRIPNVRELQSIINYGTSGPAVDSVFHQAASCTGCLDVTDPACSCTRASTYWSSTSWDGNTSDAWYVSFSAGLNNAAAKSGSRYVRAVRGGL